MYLVNGVAQDTIPVSNRSFQYGDGCFTTILTCHGVLQHWALHLERMKRCLKQLVIPEPDWILVESWIESAALPASNAGIKVHISRGEASRGYSINLTSSPTVTIHAFTYPAHYSNWVEQGIALGVCKQRLGLMPLLAGHKHNNRLEQILLKNEMDQAGYVDGIALDINGNVIETTAANLFWVQDNVLYTPDLTQSGVSGVARQLVLQESEKLRCDTVVKKLPLSHLMMADEVFVSNSLLGAAPVTQIATKPFIIGSFTRHFQEMFR